MSEWEAYERHWVEATESEIRQAILAGALVNFREIGQLAFLLSVYKAGLADVRRISAERKAAAEEQAELAAYNSPAAVDERKELADEYAIAQGYPPEGSFLGLLQPVFDLFQAPSTSPVGTAMPETLGGELLAPVFSLFHTAEQVENDNDNNGKF